MLFKCYLYLDGSSTFTIEHPHEVKIGFGTYAFGDHSSSSEIHRVGDQSTTQWGDNKG